ncbi:uncharacterized protein CANTADRAFT_47373 [Suhomyces tanzawaensis NRRL Y-17324]|uniref:Cyclin-D1-binding protein 1-like N-terminal domain-containing protein n=1 Tax=Suhomyces tanzawaensis NRRL Y-17324 TaxID=984487 RepID=A0A1E4SNK2_9ASCO|nr:uncharacterized protein CANTADRAFT_47373 [Suhomyces tanzawaensis NRRL Y-17324]ODV81093.1 hypothetical protein CANTADRAFT_47373 [Suhomyces tanzawaensis NRRL Y-17324]
MSKTREDVQKLLESYSEALQYWLDGLADPKNASKIKSAKVKAPLDELKKLAKLIRAHTTKVGIIFKPQNLAKDVGPAYTTVLKLSETTVLVISVVVQLQPGETSHLFYNEVLQQIKQLLAANLGFVGELQAVLDDVDELAKEDGSKSDEINGRLLAVGKIWATCDSLYGLVENGKLGLLTDKIKDNIGLIDDGFEEFEEWCENPQEMDDDPFGLDSEDEDEDGLDGANPPTESDDESKEELIKYAKTWLKKIELVKLLMASFKKSLPQATTGEQIDAIYGHQQDIVKLIDKLIVDLMLNGSIDEELEGITKQITQESTRLAKLAQAIHVNNSKKSKWYDTWITKF